MLSANKTAPSFVIDSNSRLDGDIEDFTYKIRLDTNNKYNKVSLIHSGIPKYYYNIDLCNNQFTLIENGVSNTVELTPGEYTMENFQTTMKSILDTASATKTPASPWTYDITFDTLTYKWTWTITDHASRTFASASIDIIEDQCYQLFGFAEELDPPVPNSFIAKSLTSDYPVCFERTNYITIKSNISHNNGNDDPDSQILARIPVKNTTYGEILTYDVLQVFDASRDLVSSQSNIFTFSLFDDHRRLLCMNGQDWFFTLMIYEYNDIDVFHKEEILYDREQRKIALQRQRLDLERKIEQNIALEQLDPNLATSVYLPPEQVEEATPE